MSIQDYNTDTCSQTDKIVTIEEARALLSTAIKSSELERRLLHKINRVNTETTEKSISVDQAKEIYRRALFNEKKSQRAYLQILESATNIEEIQEIYEHSKHDSELRKAALAKISDYYQDKLTEAKTFADAKAIYLATPKGSQIKANAICQMYKMANNLDEIKDVYGRCTHKGELKKKALTKMRLIAKNEISRAKNVYQVMRIVKKTIMNSALDQLAAKRISELE